MRESILLGALRVLKLRPYQTAWEISISLEKPVSSVSSILYRNSLRKSAKVNRRESEKEGRGFEYYLKEQTHE